MLELRRVAAIAVLGVAVLLAACDEGSESDSPEIVTTGEGLVQVQPDRATVSLGVQTRASTAAEASSANARRQRAVIDAIKAKGVPASRISTAGFNVYPEQRHQPNAPPVTTGYVVSNSVSVELDRTDLAGAVIDAAIAAGANQVHSLNFYVENADSARRAALTIAVGKARGDAEAAAMAAGGTLGALIELGTAQYQMSMNGGGRAARMEIAMAPAIEAGLQPVRATITGRWRFVPR